MDFYRARDYHFGYIKYESSVLHNTALIASEGGQDCCNTGI
ncbi:hypothetical protein [Clostridium sp.]